MKVRVDVPKDDMVGDNDYFSLKSGEIYEVIKDEDYNNRFIVQGERREVYVSKTWCTVVNTYNIEIPEELFEI
jgi:hypothetical protein